MKKIIDKIKSLMSNHPRIFVLILVLILIMVIFVIYRIADKYMNYSKIENESYYMYVGEVKHEFDAEVSINRKGVISKIEPSININWSSSPIFSKEKIVFPKDMIIVVFAENYYEYRLMPFSYINRDGDLVTKDFDNKIDNYVIYDGVDTYFFSDEGTLVVGDSTVNLSANSYVICNSKKIYYYDYEENLTGSIDLTDNAKYKSTGYVVDLYNDSVGNDGTLLPRSLDYIDFISEYNSLLEK